MTDIGITVGRVDIAVLVQDVLRIYCEVCPRNELFGPFDLHTKIEAE